MPPKKNKQAGSIGDIARNVARAGLLATSVIAPEVGVPLDIGATLLGLGRRLKGLEDRLNQQRYGDGDTATVIANPENVPNPQRAAPATAYTAEMYQNDVSNAMLNDKSGGKYVIAGTKKGGKYVIAGSEKVAGSEKLGGYEKLGGNQKGRSPLYETLKSIKE